MVDLGWPMGARARARGKLVCALASVLVLALLVQPLEVREGSMQALGPLIFGPGTLCCKLHHIYVSPCGQQFRTGVTPPAAPSTACWDLGGAWGAC